MSIRELDKIAIFSVLKTNQLQLKMLGVKRLGLFGSRVRNTPHQNSDIDLLVEFVPEQKSFDNFMRLCDLLESNLPYSIDLMTTESLSPYIKPYILKEVEYVTISA